MQENIVPHVLHSDFFEVLSVNRQGFEALVNHNGCHTYSVYNGVTTVSGKYMEGLPAVYGISGDWDVKFPDANRALADSQLDRGALASFQRHGTIHNQFHSTGSYCEEDATPAVIGRGRRHADIRINGKLVGVQWRTGQTFTQTALSRQAKTASKLT